MTAFYIGEATLEVVRQAVIEYIDVRDPAAFDRDPPEPDASAYVARRYADHPESFRKEKLRRVNHSLRLAIDFVKEIDGA